MRLFGTLETDVAVERLHPFPGIVRISPEAGEADLERKRAPVTPVSKKIFLRWTRSEIVHEPDADDSRIGAETGSREAGNAGNTGVRRSHPAADEIHAVVRGV